MAYQIICLLLMAWMLYKRVKLMLIVIDIFTSMRVIYLLCTFGMHNISELMPSAAKGLQPFIYPFGPLIEDTDSAFYQMNYTQLVFSSCAIHVAILLIFVGIKYLSSTKDS